MTPTIEDLLAKWWQDSYPYTKPINKETSAMMTQFTAYVLAQKSREIAPTITD